MFLKWLKVDYRKRPFTQSVFLLSTARLTPGISHMKRCSKNAPNQVKISSTFKDTLSFFPIQRSASHVFKCKNREPALNK